jgi:hypothetical protein
MALQDLNLNSGNWLAINCGKFPSEKNCKLVIMAPAGQREDLLDAAVAHATGSHGHQASPELRSELGKAIDTVSV